MTYDRSTGRNVGLHKVLPPVPSKWRSEVASALVHVSVTTKVLAIGAENDPVRALLLDTHAVVCEAVRWVEVEDPEEASPLKDNHLVTLVLQADVSLWGV